MNTYRTGPSDYDVRLRKNNALSHPLLYVDHIVDTAAAVIKVHVLGTTRNVYEVTLPMHSLPRCTCPDFQKRKLQCKHIYFVILRLLQLEKWGTVWSLDYATSLIDTRVNEVRPLCVDDRTRANFHVQQRQGTATGPIVRTPPSPRNEDCGFCLENLQGQDVGCCDVCRNGWHQSCWGRWSAATRKATCIICRTPVSTKPNTSAIESPYIQI